MISILIAIFTFATTIECQEISTSSCGVDKACWKKPPSCTSSTDCEFLMTYRRKTTDVNIMEFEISSKVSTGWIALGFNPSSRMSGTRGEMCIFNGATGVFQGFHANGYSPTYYPSPAANSVLTGVSLVSGAIVCRFSRPVTPSGYQGSLGPNIYPILAAGTASGGSPFYHGSNKVIGTLTDLTAFNVAATTTTTAATTMAATTTAATTTVSTPATTTATTAATTMAATTTVSTVAPTTATTAATTKNAIPIANSTDKAISASTVNSTSPSTTSMTSSKMPYNSTQSSTGAMTSPMTSPMSTNSTPTNSTPGSTVGTNGSSLIMIDLAGCNKTKGCFRVPSGCAMNSCKYIATWKSDPVKKEVRFEVMARAAGWVAFGLNAASAKMPGTYGEICYKDGSKTAIKGFHATKRGTPDIKNLNSPYLNVHQITASNGGLICRYSRKFSAMGNLGININQDLYVVVASGSGLNGGVPGYHGVTRYASKTKYNVAATTYGNVHGTAFRQVSSAAVVVLLGILTWVGQQMFN